MKEIFICPECFTEFDGFINEKEVSIPKACHWPGKENYCSFCGGESPVSKLVKKSDWIDNVTVGELEARKIGIQNNKNLHDLEKIFYGDRITVLIAEKLGRPLPLTKERKQNSCEHRNFDPVPKKNKLGPLRLRCRDCELEKNDEADFERWQANITEVMKGWTQCEHEWVYSKFDAAKGFFTERKCRKCPMMDIDQINGFPEDDKNNPT